MISPPAMHGRVREREIGLLSKRVGFDVDIEGLVYGEERLLTFICE
jgi:hypothetical protein